MKRSVAAWLTACVLPLLVAYGDPVYSDNAVAIIRVEVPAHGFSLVATPFVMFNGAEQTVDDVFGAAVPEGLTIHMWDAVSGAYVAVRYIATSGGWIDAGKQPVGNMVIGRGRGVWLGNPTASSVELCIAGMVPGAEQDNTPVELASGPSLAAFAYPATTDLGSPGAGLSPAEGDVVYLWTGTAFRTITYLPWAGGWVNSILQPVSVVSLPGDGFFYKSATARTWTNRRPYTWP